MNPIEFALYATAILAVIVFYKTLTIRMALCEREKMVDVVRDVIHNDSLPEEVKEFAIGAFHLSARSDFVRMFLLSSVKRLVFGGPRVDKPKALSDHAEVVNLLIRDHFLRVNVLAAPHWYLLVALGLVVAVVCVAVFTLGYAMGRKITRVVEKFDAPEWFIIEHAENKIGKRVSV